MTTTAPHSPIAYHSHLKLKDGPNGYVNWVIDPKPQTTAPSGLLGGMPWFHVGDTLTISVVGADPRTKAKLSFTKTKNHASAMPTPFYELNASKPDHDGYTYLTGNTLTFAVDDLQIAQPVEQDWGFTLICKDSNGNEHRFDPELQVGAGGPQKN